MPDITKEEAQKEARRLLENNTPDVRAAFMDAARTMEQMAGQIRDLALMLSGPEVEEDRLVAHLQAMAVLADSLEGVIP